ncbi:MAG: tRNA (guanosine(37)-N1)-methyltransferase TrmD [Chloroflexi bacterium]|nr:MAG: tRNA (guanosine(37)-N1)-methyltransferase TrmD [Chloroflexota bacterium]
MRIDVLTLFPNMFRGPFDESIIKRAVESGVVSIHIHDIRNWAKGRHKVADDYPYGGGAGMVLKPEPVFEATEAVLEMNSERGPIVLLTPLGRVLDHDLTLELVSQQRLVLICGHYEGIDARVHERLVTLELSIGDYVLSGGELPAMVLVDAVVRHLPGALGSPDSAGDESFTDGLLEAPPYTRPPDFRGWQVPDILLSGNHQEVARWRRHRNLVWTAQRRPDLLKKAPLTDEDREWLAANQVAVKEGDL